MANFLRQLVENDKRELRRLGKLADKVNCVRISNGCIRRR